MKIKDSQIEGTQIILELIKRAIKIAQQFGVNELYLINLEKNPNDIIPELIKIYDEIIREYNLDVELIQFLKDVPILLTDFEIYLIDAEITTEYIDKWGKKISKPPFCHICIKPCTRIYTRVSRYKFDAVEIIYMFRCDREFELEFHPTHPDEVLIVLKNS